MNCKDFESALNDMARGALLDAGERQRAETHAAVCQPCAARMSDAHALAAGLRALSSQMAEAQAPARIEANLLAAFRAQVASAPVVAAPDAPALAPLYTDERANVAPLTVKKWSWPKTFGAAGLAAAAAVILVLLVPFAFHNTSNSPATNDTPQQVATLPPVKDSAPPEIENPSSDLEKSNMDDDDQPGVKVQSPHLASTPRASRRGLTTYANDDGARGVNRARGRAAAGLVDASARPEVVTDFIPLTHGGGFAAGEGAHVVRVEVPRTALARFGLPVNAESSDRRVKADVLLGEDGIARAIRFVR